ncbi:hypothetical protein ABZ345_06035 [Lentzea sp. NPDC005914]|uniref:DUF7669 domain-containing protein n=1 Tax=Lentzea sp. NPDC005914 TaxID=3154572 RepID=UPI0033FFACC4
MLRFATARSLVAGGVEAATLWVEAPHPALKGLRVDLAVGRPRPKALIEFKFPREPHQMNAPWTMALGEVLKDFYRLATYPGDVDRIFVYVESNRLRSYMAGAAQRYGVDLDTDAVELIPAVVAALPPTALGSIGTYLAGHHVTATRLAAIPIDDTLRLTIYEVAPHTNERTEGSPEPKRPTPLVEAAGTASGIAPATRAIREGARREILDAVRAVLTRSGASTFTLAEIVTEMSRRNTGYADSTIRTMVTSLLCRNAPDHASITYDDLERVGRGIYRLATD